MALKLQKQNNCYCNFEILQNHSPTNQTFTLCNFSCLITLRSSATFQQNTKITLPLTRRSLCAIFLALLLCTHLQLYNKTLKTLVP